VLGAARSCDFQTKNHDYMLEWDACNSWALSLPYPLHRLQHPLPYPALGAGEHLASHLLGRMEGADLR